MGLKIIILCLISMLGFSNKPFIIVNSSPNFKPQYDTIRLEELPSIGDHLDESIRLTSNNRNILINSSQISPSTTVYVKGIVFKIAWDRDSKINFISTTDSTFYTNENIRINMPLKEIENIQNVEITKMPGWGYYISLESGWFAGFCVDKTCTGRELTNEVVVSYFFKR